LSENDTHAAGGSADDDPDAASTVFIGIVGTLLLATIVVALQGLFEHAARIEFERKVVAEAPLELRDLQSAQLALLNGYRWVDPKAGVAGIPIERAMELLAQERKAATAKP
jgi:hypothetical protein